MDYFQAIVLGTIQGITEWLPVSSKSMVALAGRYAFGMGFGDALATAIWLHTGTLAAAIAYFRNDAVSIARALLSRDGDRSMLLFLAVATLVTGLMGVPLLFIALNVEVPDSAFTVLIGALLVVMAAIQKSRQNAEPETQNQKQAAGVREGVVAGAAQGLAAIPGVSRSGMTLAALMAQGYPLEKSLRLSFLMSIPAVAGIEIVLPLMRGGFEITGPHIAGSAAAALAGFVTIGALLRVAARPDFYRVTMALGLAVLLCGLLML